MSGVERARQRGIVPAMPLRSPLESRRALLVHNRNAGTDPTPRERIEAALHAVGLRTTYCAHLEDDLDAALREDFDLVVAAGGDGTLADVASSLCDVERPIGVLPLGGSNNIAHALGVEGDWQDIPARWSLSRWRPLDRCEADGPWGRRPFIEAVGTGVLTQSVDYVDDDPETAEEKRANGRAAFRQALAEAAPFPCRIDGADWSWEGDCLMVEVLSIPFVGPRLRLAHGADPGDGLLDVMIVEPGDREALRDWVNNPEAAPCPLTPRRASMVRLGVHGRCFRLDDRSPDDRLSGIVTIRIRPQPVRILVHDKAGTT
jgi:diacylglycerol kinase (ATP)